jgi:hypothetical protein
LEASQQFSFLQGRVVSPTPDPHPGLPGLCIYIPQRQGGPVIPPGTGYPFLVASYDTHGLRWDYSYFPVTTREKSWELNYETFVSLQKGRILKGIVLSILQLIIFKEVNEPNFSN